MLKVVRECLSHKSFVFPKVLKVLKMLKQLIEHLPRIGAWERPGGSCSRKSFVFPKVAKAAKMANIIGHLAMSSGGSSALSSSELSKLLYQESALGAPC